MNKINNLLKKLCPNGVEYMRLEELLDYTQPTKYIVNKTDYSDNFKIPVLTAGQSFILGYTNEDFGVYQASKDNPCIIFDDFTTSFHWVDFPFKVKSSAIKILNCKKVKQSLKYSKKIDSLKNEDNFINSSSSPSQGINIRFIFYAMKCIFYKTKEHKRQWIGEYSNIKIPIPPLEIQNEISFILDRFTKLQSKLQYELQTELQLRKKQYEYYLNSMLTFSKDKLYCYPKINNLLKKLCPNGVEYMRLGEIGKVSMCKRIFKNQTKERGDIPFYKIGTFGKEANSFINKKIFNEYKIKYSYPKKGELLISASGTIGKVVIYDGEEAYYQDSNIVWIENKEEKILNKFLFYCYQNIKWENHFSKGGTIARLYNKNLKNLKIPIPPLEIQNEIVLILDKFNTLANDLNNGIPAEIELRKKQYEYYRNELLSFKEKKV